MTLWKTLVSMKAGLILLLLIILEGFAGSIIPQGQNEYFYVKNFGQVKETIISQTVK